MRISKFIATLSVVALAGLFQAKADIVVSNPAIGSGASWQNLTKAKGDGTGNGGTNGFWDNHSSDNSGQGQCNIGALLLGNTNPSQCNNRTGEAVLSLPKGAGVYDFLQAGATPDSAPAFAFYNNSGTDSAHNSILHVEIAGDTTNALGYEVFDGSGVISNGTLFGSGDVGKKVGTSVSLAAGQSLRFWYMIDAGTFYSDSKPASDKNRFALFRTPQGAATDASIASYVLGLEDGDQAIGDWDYQDMVVSVTVVPEPGTTAVLVSAVGAMLFCIRRRRAARN